MNRIRELRRMRRMTLEELASRVGSSAQQIQRLETGQRQLKPDWMRRLAAALDVRWVELVEDMGAIEAEHVGIVGAGERILPYDQEHGRERLPAPPRLKAPVAAVTVRGDSMLPAYRDGDTLYYERADAVDRHALGNDSVVQLASGEMMVKVVQRGSAPGLYHLLSYNHPDIIADQTLTFAAPILWVQRALRIVR